MRRSGTAAGGVIRRPTVTGISLGHSTTHLCLLKQRVQLKRCTEYLSALRAYEETIRCRFDPAPEPIPAEATHLSPPCCVSTHRSHVVDPSGPPTFLDHREAFSGIPQMTSFARRPGHLAPLPVESLPPAIYEDSHWGEARCSRVPCRRGSHIRSPSVGDLSGFAPAICSF